MLSEEQAIEIVSNLKTYYEAYYLLSNEEIEENEEKNEAIEIVLKLIIRLEKENEDIQNRKEHQKLRFKKYKENIEKQHEEIYEDLVSKQEEKDKQINQALDIAFKYGQIDGEHHKAWVIDQMVKVLTGKEYDKWINNYIYDEETGDSYTWDKGIAP